LSQTTTYLAARRLHLLRQADHSGTVRDNAPLVEGIYFSWDSAAGDVTLDLESPPGMLCRVTGHVSGTPGWLTLNIALGTHGFAPGDVLGVVADVTGPPDAPCALYVRSQHHENLFDTPLCAPLAGCVKRNTQVLLHTIDAQDPMIGTAGFHTLVLPLPRQDFTLALHDLQIFTLPAALGLRSQPVTLSGFAT